MKYAEARKLKKGTPILIRTKAVSVDISGDIVYETRARDQEYEVMYAKTGYQYADIQTPEKSKYDPCRKFKKGDKVQVISLNGRCYGKYGKYLLGAYCIVLGDEADEFGVRVRHNADDYILDPAYIELVTPVEELEPYSMEECGATCEVWNNSDDRAIVAMFFKSQYRSNQARELAEAECERLNAEWRKMQNYKQD